ncbi:MAG: GNAT family N-acetyltransferase [bacterium]|nr:GNAT family N-acetyltransferase [bacterium]
MSTTIRPATAADRDFVAWTILAASRSHLPRGAWDISLDAPEPDVLAFIERLTRVEPATFCHWRGFLLAEVDGTPAAALSAYDAARVADVDAAVASELSAMDWTPEQMLAADARFKPFLTCVPDQPAGTWIVEWVATRPEFRRRGLVDALLEEILARGRRAGYRDAQISILMGNDPARRAYEKTGFTLQRERTHPEFAELMGCPGIAQYGRTL